MTSSSCGARNSDLAYQAEVLQGVSRTFALTIPELPGTLRDVVSNAYLLCRITDTIEDEPALSTAQKQRFWRRFVDVVAGRDDAADFAQQLGASLSSSTTASEHDLVANTPRVLGITDGFRVVQRRAIRTLRAHHVSGEWRSFSRSTHPRAWMIWPRSTGIATTSPGWSARCSRSSSATTRPR